MGESGLSSGLDSNANASFLGWKNHKLNIAWDAKGPTFPFINQGEGERLELLRLLARSDIGLISMPIVPGS